MLENNNIQVVSKQARHRSTNMLRHMSNIMFDFFEDLPTDLPTYLPTYRPTYISSPICFVATPKHKKTVPGPSFHNLSCACFSVLRIILLTNLSN